MEPDVLAEAIDAMYRNSPEAFISARDELARELRAQGAREAAAEVGKLRKPTVAAWVVNLLVLDQPELPAQLGELAEQLREAQEQLAGDELRALGRQRHQLVAGLVARARDLARGSGRPVNADVLGEVESSLRAALTDPAVAVTVLSGRLTSPVGAEGFGPASIASSRTAQPIAASNAAPKQAGRQRDEAAPHELSPAEVRAQERRRATELRKAERELEKAEADLSAAEEEHSEAEVDAAQAAEVLSTADERVTWLRAQLQQAEAELAEAQAAHEAACDRERMSAGLLMQAHERVEGARAKADLI